MGYDVRKPVQLAGLMADGLEITGSKRSIQAKEALLV